MQLFSRALNVSEQELFKMMEQGQLVSSEVLPKVAKEFRKAATEGGAYALALQGLRVKEGQFMTGMQRAGKTIFNSGFEEGLSNLYGTLSEIFENSGPQLKKLGKIFGDVFNAIATGLKVLEPVMKFAIDNFYTLLGAKAIHTLLSFQSILHKASWSMAASWARAFAPISLALVAIDELYSMIDDTKIGLIEKTYGKQINLLKGTTSDFVEKDGKFYAKDSSFKGFNDKKSPLSPEEFAKLSNKGKSAEMSRILNRGTSLSNAFRHVEGAENMKYSGVSGLWSSSEGNATIVTNNIVINNGQMDELKRALAGKESVATQARGK